MGTYTPRQWRMDSYTPVPYCEHLESFAHTLSPHLEHQADIHPSVSRYDVWEEAEAAVDPTPASVTPPASSLPPPPEMASPRSTPHRTAPMSSTASPLAVKLKGSGAAAAASAPPPSCWGDPSSDSGVGGAEGALGSGKTMSFLLLCSASASSSMT